MMDRKSDVTEVALESYATRWPSFWIQTGISVHIRQRGTMERDISLPLC